MIDSQTSRAAIYARVSSEQQAQQKTIDSQVEALKERVGQDGLILDNELTHYGVELVFLNHALGTSPEEDLLLQVQGMISE